MWNYSTSEDSLYININWNISQTVWLKTEAIKFESIDFIVYDVG